MVVHPDHAELPIVALGPADAGELLTLQRAAYVPEAQSHEDVRLPPLTQTLAELRAELCADAVTAWGIRENGRLLGAVRVRICGPDAWLSRLAVVPDRQGEGLGTRLLRHAEARLPEPTDVLGLCTGEYSHANLRLYARHGYRETHRVDAGSHQVVHLNKPIGTAPLSAGVLRKARAADLPALLELLNSRAAWLHARGIVRQWPSPFPRGVIEANVTTGETWIIVAGADVLATFVVTGADKLWDDLPASAAYLHRLAVHENCAGLGAELLARLATQFRNAGRDAVRLDCVADNRPLGAYYQRAGYVFRGQRTVHAGPEEGWPPGSSAEVHRYELALR